ncbi:MAG: Protein RecA [candidate division TM6 bacterium GW2011_GWF2_38_10]|nr:MAG: Protein RecA [candidate division TM6 bacterium GW2011_GWF2_38_10]
MAKQPLEEAKKLESKAGEKVQALEAAFAQIDKQFGKGSIMLLGQRAADKIDVVSTGSILIDQALGVGGLPKGRIVEVFGPESSGKTTLTLHVIAQAQKKGGVCAFIDAEHAMDPSYATSIGININDLIISQPDFGEQALEITEMLVRSNAVDLIVVDSVAALVPKAELEGDMGDSHMGLQARLMSQAMRKLTAAVSKSKTVLVFINQIRQKINGLPFGDNETTTGGNALKFYSSIRLDVRRIGTLKRNDKPFGNRVLVKVVKNKVAPPFRRAEVDLIFGEGISQELDLLDAALSYNIVTQAGAWFNFGEERVAQGRDNCLKKFKEDPAFFERVMDAVREKIVQA